MILGNVFFFPQEAYEKSTNFNEFLSIYLCIRWLEFWSRKQRQYVCRSQTWTDEVFESAIHSTVYSAAHDQSTSCDNNDENSLENELREVTCSNKNSEPLIEVHANKIQKKTSN